MYIPGQASARRMGRKLEKTGETGGGGACRTTALVYQNITVEGYYVRNQGNHLSTWTVGCPPVKQLVGSQPRCRFDKHEDASRRQLADQMRNV